MQLHSLILTSSQQHWLIHQLHIYSPGCIQRSHLKPICLTLPSLHNIFHPLQKRTWHDVSDSSPHTPSLFIIPFSGLSVTRRLIPLLCWWTPTPTTLILFPDMALCLWPARPGFSGRIKGRAVCFPAKCKWTDRRSGEKSEGRVREGKRTTGKQTKKVRLEGEERLIKEVTALTLSPPEFTTVCFIAFTHWASLRFLLLTLLSVDLLSFLSSPLSISCCHEV